MYMRVSIFMYAQGPKNEYMYQYTKYVNRYVMRVSVGVYVNIYTCMRTNVYEHVIY